MLVNAALELARSLSLRSRVLRQRARRTKSRPPLIVIPSMLGTILRDASGRVLWGGTRNLYLGAPIGTAANVRAAGALEQLALIPGVYSYDVLGGLLRFLERVGGYRRGEDLFVLAYDWREGVVSGARELARLVQRVRGVGDELVDLLCLSSGGLIARYFIAFGSEDVRGSRAGEAAPHGADLVRRVVYLGTPQRGSASAVSVLERGFTMAPAGRHFGGDEAAQSQLCFDLLPHPDDAVFVDESGNRVTRDLYHTDTWSELGLRAACAPGFRRKLELARALHDAFERRTRHPDAVVIGAHHLPTLARLRIQGGAATFPCCPNRGSLASATYEPGDGAVSEASLRGLPGLEPRRFWFVRARVHHAIPSHPDAHRLALEALLASPPLRAVEAG